MHLQQTHRHKTSYINFREVGGRLGGCDNNRNPDGGRRLSPTVVVIPIGHIGASVGHLGAICGDWLVLVLHRASTVEGSFRFLWQIVFLLVFLPLEQQHTGALYQLINTYRSTATCCQNSSIPPSSSCSIRRWRTDTWLMLSQKVRPSFLRGNRMLGNKKKREENSQKHGIRWRFDCLEILKYFFKDIKTTTNSLILFFKCEYVCVSLLLHIKRWIDFQ